MLSRCEDCGIWGAQAAGLFVSAASRNELNRSHRKPLMMYDRRNEL